MRGVVGSSYSMELERPWAVGRLSIKLRLGAPSKRVMLSARTNNPNPHVPVIHTRAAQQLSRFAYRR